MLQQLPVEGHASGCGQAAQWPVLAVGMSKALFAQRTACTACSMGVWYNPPPRSGSAGTCSSAADSGSYPLSLCRAMAQAQFRFLYKIMY